MVYYIAAIVLLIVWVIGTITSFVFNGLIHLFLILGILLIIGRLIVSRKNK